MSGGPELEAVTLKEGPPGIETQRHVDAVVAPLARMIAERERDCAAFVIACYSDPGLHTAREATAKPVLGISECGVLTALTLGQRFGVIAILKNRSRATCATSARWASPTASPPNCRSASASPSWSTRSARSRACAKSAPRCATRMAPTWW